MKLFGVLSASLCFIQKQGQSTASINVYKKHFERFAGIKNFLSWPFDKAAYPILTAAIFTYTDFVILQTTDDHRANSLMTIAKNAE